MTDITTRLLSMSEAMYMDRDHDELDALLLEAKSRIESLEAALKPFSEFAGIVFERNFENSDPVDTITASDGRRVTLYARDYFAARAALIPQQKGNADAKQ